MATHHVEHFAAPPDVELHLARDQPVRYDLAWPEGLSDTDPPPGLVLLIPGFGQDNDDGYLRAFRTWVAERFGLACMTVQYHGIRNRPAQGAKAQFNAEDGARLAQACQAHGIAWPKPPAAPNLNALIGQLIRVHDARAAATTTPGETLPALTLTCGLLSPDGPVNLGLLQAMDHLHALHHLNQQRTIDTSNIIAVGSSHGGYLAQLCHKLAPQTFRAVFDNSGYAALPDRFIDGRPTIEPDYYESLSPTVRMAYFVTSAWSHDPEAPNHYHDAARAIRNLAEPSHLQALRNAVDRPAVIRCVHAPDDDIAPTAEKQRYVEQLQALGFDATLKIATEADIDGQLIKSLDHGLGLSLRIFFETCHGELPEDISQPLTKIDNAIRTEIRFATAQQAYYACHDCSGMTLSYR